MVLGNDAPHADGPAQTQLTFRSLTEDAPGKAWRRVVAHGWPGWREWFTERGGGELSLTDARRALRRHMPEIETLWDDLVNTADAGNTLRRFLSFWCPPRYLVNCSQAVLVDDDGPLLIRNYDLDPALNEATMLTTNWRGTRVIGMVEAMSGLADGMNEHGLAASLTFGGRIEVGKGFGIPLIMRYVLQMCRDVTDAVEVLRAVPSHMSYNITLADASGKWATVFITPDRPTMVQEQPWATNHQIGVEWPRHGRISNTLGRAEHLERLLTDPATNATRLNREFLQSPIFSTNYRQGFGTVYTAAYRPTQGRVRLSWHDGTSQDWNIAKPVTREQSIAYSDGGSYALPSPNYIAHDPHPAWFGRFIAETHATNKGPEQARLAAFWRRNHYGTEGDWSNLVPVTTKTTQEDH
ncbi:C45 family autoproteolytic acyltransferase/hydolase [Aliiroseovarius sp. PrR006]|uniref:C45 family autoproteolytic acyltransferase/hydolase n=1 Tax=Aliiroseovarius sp. PrR006 TaxID=2706883 RepID=UPI0013D8114B|nr:C45 family peptidase [Aliiroseovarius sp. PrR006]NDW54494.1 hypothetical protein [Aliiroseovarius sp. PrR006]